MSESVGSTDALTDTLDKVLTDLVTLTNTTLKSVNKPLADTTTISDALAKSLSHAFADSVTASDAKTITATKALADSISFTSALVTTFVKHLADSVTLTDSEQAAITHILMDSLLVQDSVITFTFTKALADILLLQDWLSLRLSKPSQWTVNVPAIPSSTLYGQILFGRKLYSGQGGTSAIWNTQPVVQPNTNGWKSFNQLEDQN